MWSRLIHSTKTFHRDPRDAARDSDRPRLHIQSLLLLWAAASSRNWDHHFCYLRARALPFVGGRPRNPARPRLPINVEFSNKKKKHFATLRQARLTLPAKTVLPWLAKSSSTSEEWLNVFSQEWINGAREMAYNYVKQSGSGKLRNIGEIGEAHRQVGSRSRKASAFHSAGYQRSGNKPKCPEGALRSFQNRVLSLRCGKLMASKCGCDIAVSFCKCLRLTGNLTSMCTRSLTDGIVRSLPHVIGFGL